MSRILRRLTYSSFVYSVVFPKDEIFCSTTRWVKSSTSATSDEVGGNGQHGDNGSDSAAHDTTSPDRSDRSV